MKTLSRTFLCLLLSLTASSSLLWADTPTGPAVVNINTADAVTLAKSLKGIGANKAEAIVQYRETVGGFQSAEELTEIKGIGLKLVKANRERIVLQ